MSEEDKELKWSDGSTLLALNKIPVVALKRIEQSLEEQDLMKLTGITTKEKDKPEPRRRRRRGRPRRR